MTVMYDKLDAVLARPAHQTYDRDRVRFFTEAHSPRPELLATAERHAERAGWACRWDHGQDYDMTVTVYDREGSKLGQVAGIDARDITRDYARVMEAYLGAQVLAGDPSYFYTRAT